MKNLIMALATALIVSFVSISAEASDTGLGYVIVEGGVMCYQPIPQGQPVIPEDGEPSAPLEFTLELYWQLGYGDSVGIYMSQPDMYEGWLMVDPSYGSGESCLVGQGTIGTYNPLTSHELAEEEVTIESPEWEEAPAVIVEQPAQEVVASTSNVYVTTLPETGTGTPSVARQLAEPFLVLAAISLPFVAAIAVGVIAANRCEFHSDRTQARAKSSRR